MPLSSTTRVIEALRATLIELEQTSGLSADDPAFLNLKSILVRRIADLEAERLADAAGSQTPSLSDDSPDAIAPPLIQIPE